MWVYRVWFCTQLFGYQNLVLFSWNPLGSPAIQVFIECIAGSKYMNTSLPRQFASCTREGLVFTGMHKSRYESSLHLICFLPRIKRGTTSTGMTKYHCLLNINNINKLIMQNSVANWKLKGIPSQKTGFFSYVIEGYSLIKSVWLLFHNGRKPWRKKRKTIYFS